MRDSERSGAGVTLSRVAGEDGAHRAAGEGDRVGTLQSPLRAGPIALTLDALRLDLSHFAGEV
jgi:hypothetical protein